MTRKLFTLMLLSMLVVAVMAISTQASTSAKAQRTRDYGFQNNSTLTARQVSTTALGAFTADGGSPGYIVGRSFRDDQAHLQPGHFVDWRYDPRIHFVFAGQGLAGHNDPGIARWIEYTMFDPTVSPLGVWQTPVWIQSNPLSTGGWYPNMDVDETSHCIAAGDEFDPADVVRNAGIYWDMAGPGAYGTFIPDLLPQALSLDAGSAIIYPMVEYQDFGGGYVVHVVANEYPPEPVCGNGFITYWRKTVSASGGAGTWTTTLVADDVWSDQMDIAAARGGSGNVAIAWIIWPGFCNNAGGDTEGQAWVMESTDAGASWGTPFEIVDTLSDDNYRPWVDIDTHYDTEGQLHVLYNGGVALTNSIDPSRILHWSRRVTGPDAGGTTSLVHIADFAGLAPMCGRGSSNVQNIGKANMSECDGKLYITWVQYGNYDYGDTTDCADANFPNDNGAARYNGELYISVASDLDGLLWDAARNLTNSHTPGCDGTDVNNCDHDTYGNMARYGMTTSDYGDTYWGAVPEAFAVRDAMMPTWPEDSSYIDYWYINDLFTEPARYDNDQETAIWTYSPIKWFRLPCIDPIIEPRINISQADLLHPAYWIKNGETETEDLVIENIGNATLSVYSITPNEIQGSGWLTILTPSMTIPPASDALAQFTIDASGYAAGTTTALEAEIIISSNDADGDLIYNINTIAADTVVVPTWDTVATTLPMSLVVSTHGNAGFSGQGEVNMDFVAAGDCDATQTVYLYDLSPVVFLAEDNYSYQPFWNGGSQGVGPENFQPIAGGIDPAHVTTDDYDMATSGTFVTSDSTVGCTKYFVAPAKGVSYMLERWDIYSYDDASHTGVRLGEWIDWDAPTGLNGNEGGYVENTGHVDYVWQQGVVNPAANPVPCLNEDLRFGASGLLGYYTSTEYAADESVNHTGLTGGFILLDADVFQDGTDDFIVDSAWALLNRTGFSANNSDDDDQQAWLTFGTFDITPGDTLTIWTVHASIYDGDEYDLQEVIDSAEVWYDEHRPDFHFSGCCGVYTDLPTWPEGYTGNTNCSIDGKRTLSDITKLIDNVYISKDPLCCYASGNTNGSWDDGECKITLSDITKLIDAVYISKNLTEPCIAGCEE